MVVSVRVCTLKSYFHFKLVVFTIRLRLGHREGQVLVRGGLSPLKTFKTACGMVNQQWVEFDFSLGTFVSWQPPPPLMDLSTTSVKAMLTLVGDIWVELGVETNISFCVKLLVRKPSTS